MSGRPAKPPADPIRIPNQTLPTSMCRGFRFSTHLLRLLHCSNWASRGHTEAASVAVCVRRDASARFPPPRASLWWSVSRSQLVGEARPAQAKVWIRAHVWYDPVSPTAALDDNSAWGTRAGRGAMRADHTPCEPNVTNNAIQVPLRQSTHGFSTVAIPPAAPRGRLPCRQKKALLLLLLLLLPRCPGCI